MFLPLFIGAKGQAETGDQLLAGNPIGFLQAGVGQLRQLQCSFTLRRMPVDVVQGDAQHLFVAETSQHIKLVFVMGSRLHQLRQVFLHSLAGLGSHRIGTGDQGVEDLRMLDENAGEELAGPEQGDEHLDDFPVLGQKREKGPSGPQGTEEAL